MSTNHPANIILNGSAPSPAHSAGQGSVEIRKADGATSPKQSAYTPIMPSLAHTNLPTDSSIEILSVWATTLAESLGIRALLIKGPMLGDYGLRHPRVSSDVDIYIDPARTSHYCETLTSAGWTPMPETFARTHFVLHSHTFRHPNWPAMIDVHHAYPGFLQDETTVFEHLWSRRATRDYAGIPCPVADRVASVAILGLHSLRGTKEQQRHEAELGELLKSQLTDSERTAIAQFAHDVGASVPLAEVLPQLGITTAPNEDERLLPTYPEWRRKYASASGAAASWLFIFKNASWAERPGIVARAIWPTREDLLANNPSIVDHPLPRATARIKRWINGVRHLPAALKALSHSPRNSAAESSALRSDSYNDTHTRGSAA